MLSSFFLFLLFFFFLAFFLAFFLSHFLGVCPSFLALFVVRSLCCVSPPPPPACLSCVPALPTTSYYRNTLFVLCSLPPPHQVDSNPTSPTTTNLSPPILNNFCVHQTLLLLLKSETHLKVIRNNADISGSIQDSACKWYFQHPYFSPSSLTLYHSHPPPYLTALTAAFNPLWLQRLPSATPLQPGRRGGLDQHHL